MIFGLLGTATVLYKIIPSRLIPTVVQPRRVNILYWSFVQNTYIPTQLLSVNIELIRRHY